MSKNIAEITVMNDLQLKAAIEEAAIARLIGRPALVKAASSHQRSIEAYYKMLAETNDEVLALRAAREASY